MSSSRQNRQTNSRRLRVLITAGPTREKIDPVRFISNYSTGFMGYSIARRARAKGHRVVLISGPAALERPAGVKRILVESAADMRKAVLRELPGCDALIMAAAVCDWRPEKTYRRKLKKGRKAARAVRASLRLVENPDILREAFRRAKKQLLIGFALETEGLLKNAREKLLGKNLDAIVANRLRGPGSVFGPRKSDFLILDRHGKVAKYRNISKEAIAGRIIDKVESLWYISA